MRGAHLISACCHNIHSDSDYSGISLAADNLQSSPGWDASDQSLGRAPAPYCWLDISLDTLKYCQFDVADLIFHLPIEI